MKKKILISFILVLMILCNIKVYATSETAELPSKYDLRNDINIRVENQGKLPWCGQYAETKMVETYLQKTKGLNYNLSEAYLAHWSTFGGTYGKQVLESDLPNKEYQVTEANQKKFDNAISKAVVEKFEFMKNIEKNRNVIKEYITKYGGVFSTTMCDNQMDNYKGGMYRSGKSTVNRGEHGVLIIGWDDNYSKDNFVYEKPENDGAWLILNSWGTQWGNKGTAWVSYEDYYKLEDEAAAIQNLTLTTGEVIRTGQEEVKETKTNTTNNMQIIAGPSISGNNNVEGLNNQGVFETSITEQPNIFKNVFVILFIVTFILLVVVVIITLKLRKHKNK